MFIYQIIDIESFNKLLHLEYLNKGIFSNIFEARVMSKLGMCPKFGNIQLDLMLYIYIEKFLIKRNFFF